MAVLGAACEDLGISRKPDALRLYPRRALRPNEQPPPLRAWNPLTGEFATHVPTMLTDTTPTRQLGVPRGPRAGAQEYRRRVQNKLDLS